MENNNKTPQKNIDVDSMGNSLAITRKQTGKHSYGTLFLKKCSMNRRGDKTIYLRPEYHERLSRIVQVIGGNHLPLYAYLDNILKHHFKVFEDTIAKEFKEKYKALF
jgi:hypothetical protein